MSKRRTRPGGVMARATKRSAVQRGLDAVLGKALPVGLGGGEGPSADQQAGLLIGLADRRQRDGAGAGCAVARLVLPTAWRSRRGCRPPATAMRLSAGSVRPPGNTNLPGMKACRAWRRPISTLQLAALAVEQDQRRRVARPQRPSPPSAKSLRLRPVSTCRLWSCPSIDGSSRHSSGWVSMRVVLAAEAVHVERPLQADDGALDRPQQSQRQRRCVSGTQIARCCQVDSVLVASTP